MGQKWYQSKAYDLSLFWWTFFFFKGTCPFKLNSMNWIIFLRWISCPWAGNSLRKSHSYNGFHVYELVIPGRLTFIPWKASVGSPRTKFFQWIPRLCAGNSRQKYYLSREGRVLAVRGRKILRMVTNPGFLAMKDLHRLRNFFVSLS
jgi:hypothetical protein